MSKEAPLRTCLGCRTEKQKGELVRLVADPLGQVVIDYKGKLPGRGAYVCPSESCVRDAFAKKQVSRFFKGSYVGPEELLESLRERVQEKLCSVLSLSRKAGKVVDGREAVEKALDRGDVKLLLLAEDLSGGSYKELTEKCVRKGTRYSLYLQKDRIGALLGTGERGAVGITDESFSRQLERELGRLKGLGIQV